MEYHYKTKGTCSRTIDVELDGDRIKAVKFHGGCNGNLKGITTLVQGPPREIIEKCRGDSVRDAGEPRAPTSLPAPWKKPWRLRSRRNKRRNDDVCPQRSPIICWPARCWMTLRFGQRQKLLGKRFFMGRPRPRLLLHPPFFSLAKGEKLKGNRRTASSDPSFVDFFDFAQEYENSAQGNDTSLSYVLGFLCHYAFDSVAHPLSNYGAEMLHELIKPSTVEACHNEVEANLDVILLPVRAGGIADRFWLEAGCAEGRPGKTGDGGFYQQLAARLYGVQISREFIAQAADDCRTAFGWTQTEPL